MGVEQKKEEEKLREVLSDLCYFWNEKGDLERLCYFNEPETQSLLQKYRPDILKAWADYKASLLILNSILR
jgi:hypothetical protein